MNPTEIIDKYGKEITSALKLATEQLYDKIIWYTRVSGIIDVITFFIVMILEVISFFVAKKFYKENEAFEVWGCWIVCALFIALLGGLLVPEMVMSLAKIFAPEYYIMHQIISGLNTSRR